jgi:hypothetical protein
MRRIAWRRTRRGDAAGVAAGVFEAEGVEVVEGFDAVEVGVVDLGRFGVGSVDVD